MIGIAAAWIFVLLAGGAFALDRVLSNAITRNFDAQLSYALTAMIASAEIGPDGEIRFSRPLGDQRFLRSEEHTSELQPLMRISYAVLCLTKKQTTNIKNIITAYITITTTTTTVLILSKQQ